MRISLRRTMLVSVYLMTNASDDSSNNNVHDDDNNDNNDEESRQGHPDDVGLPGEEHDASYDTSDSK